MSGSLLTSTIAIGLALISLHTPASGGCSGAAFDEWPAQVIAHQPFTIGFSLGVDGYTGSVEFFEGQKPAATPLRFDVRPALGKGHYTALITLPKGARLHE